MSLSRAGVGKSHKPYYINLRKEIAFNREANGVAYDGSNRSCEFTNSQFAVSGPIAEQPSFTPKNKKGAVPKHSEISANHKVLKLGEESELSYKISVENWRPLYRIMGGIIDYPRRFEMSSDSGDWAADDVVTGETSGAVAAVESYSSPDLVLKEWTNDEALTGDGSGVGTLLMIQGNELILNPRETITNFAADEVVTGSSSGAKAKIEQVRRIIADISSVSGTFQVGETVEDSTNTAQGIVVHVDSNEIEIYMIVSDQFTDEQITGQNSSATATLSNRVAIGYSLYEFQDSETVTNTGTGTGSVDDIVFGHYIFAYRNQQSYSGPYVYESLSTQHLMTGMIANKVTIEATSNDVPKITEEMFVTEVDFDDNIDDEVSNSETTLYDFSDLDLVMNSLDKSDIYRTITIEITRELSRIHGNSIVAKGIKGPTIEFNITMGIHREDKSIHNYRLNDTSFPVKYTFRRGNAGEDECILYYDNSFGGANAQVRAMEIPETENEKTIFIDTDYDVTGKPVFQAYDKIPHYG